MFKCFESLNFFRFFSLDRKMAIYWGTNENTETSFFPLHFFILTSWYVCILHIKACIIPASPQRNLVLSPFFFVDEKNKDII